MISSYLLLPLDWQGLYRFPNDKVNSITIKAQGVNKENYNDGNSQFFGCNAGWEQWVPIYVLAPVLISSYLVSVWHRFSQSLSVLF
jgi:hypothetical protein